MIPNASNPKNYLKKYRKPVSVSLAFFFFSKFYQTPIELIVDSSEVRGDNTGLKCQMLIYL
jgi:hypothetical protein